jgi:formate-dependent nitrite reductase cytochrome c552 subunit
MEFSQFIPLLITFVVTLIGSYITIRITIAEIKKDLTYLKERLEQEVLSKVQHETQAKEDMREVKDELKMIFKSINEIQINFARMEARNEGKDEVINELKNAVTTIISGKQS